MKNLRSISCVLFICIASPQLNAQAISDRPFVLPMVDGLYKLNMQIRNLDLTGLILLSRLSDSSFRLVMTSEFGPKLLDLELLPSGYKINYAYPKLKRKRVLESFYKDFGSLCCVTIWRKNPVITSGTEVNESLYNLEKREKIIYTYTAGSKVCSQGRIERKAKIITMFYYFATSDSAVMSRMQLDHKNFAMSIKLEKID